MSEWFEHTFDFSDVSMHVCRVLSDSRRSPDEE